MTAWLDRVAADLLHTEAALRTSLRDLARLRRPRHGPHGTPAGLADPSSGLLLSGYEARTLLRGTMPTPIATGRLRRPHARLVAALSVFAMHLVGLNDVQRTPDAAIDSAGQLVHALLDWHRSMSEVRADREHRRAAQAAINAILRLGTLAGREQTTHAPQPGVESWHAGHMLCAAADAGVAAWSTSHARRVAADAADVPNVAAGLLRMPVMARALPGRLRRLRAEQRQLDLWPGAEIVDLRQMRLRLEQEGTNDATRHATA